MSDLHVELFHVGVQLRGDGVAHGKEALPGRAPPQAVYKGSADVHEAHELAALGRKQGDLLGAQGVDRDGGVKTLVKGSGCSAVDDHVHHLHDGTQ